MLKTAHACLEIHPSKYDRLDTSVDVLRHRVGLLSFLLREFFVQDNLAIYSRGGELRLRILFFLLGELK